MSGRASSAQSAGDGPETSPVLTTGVTPLPQLTQGSTTNSTDDMGNQRTNGVTHVDTATSRGALGVSTSSNTVRSPMLPLATTSSIPPSTPDPGSASSVANTASSVQPSQPSQPVYFGPPPPPAASSLPSRAQATHGQNGIPEGVIHGILEGLFGPMANLQRVHGPVSNATGSTSNQGHGNHGHSPNTGSSGQASGPPPDLGPVFSMFGTSPSTTHASGSGTSAANPSQEDRAESSPTQSEAASARSSSGGAGSSTAQRHGPFGQSEYSFTFDLGPIDFPILSGGGNPFGIPSNGNRNETQDAAAQGRPDDRSRHPPDTASAQSGSTALNAPTAPTDNDPNSNNRPPPFTFILGPNGNWMQPNVGAGAGGSNSGSSGEASAENGNPASTGGGDNQAPPLAPPLFQIFSRLFQNGMQPGGGQPGLFNFSFGFPSFLQTRLPPDPERAEELLRGLKDPGMDLMIRLDRVVRADNAGTSSSGGQEAGSEGDAGGWKCAVCMEGLEDEFEAHKQDDAAPDSAGHAEAEPGSSSAGRISRTNSLASDSDMHDVEMAINGETRECPRNKTSLKVFPCHHVFHEDCLKPWLAQKTTCPTCRFDIDPHSVTLRRPVMPQGRDNPLRPRMRNAATSNVRATPYGSRPISPSASAQALNPSSSGLSRTRPMSAGDSQESIGASVENEAAAPGNTSSTTGPAFSQSEVPRSPFAFPRPDRNNSQQTNTTAHVDRPPPVQGANALAGNPDGALPQTINSGANLTQGGMQDAVQMLHELMNRVGRHDGPSRTTSSNNVAPETSRSPATANANHSSNNSVGSQPSQSDHDMNVDGDREQGEDDNHAHADHDHSRHPHSHTIAIFEIALPDMPADMMPDSFQGLNDGAPQPFGPNAFRSFMVPFPGMGLGNETANHADDNTNNNGNAEHTNSSVENPQTSSGTSAGQGNNEGEQAPSDPASSTGSSSNQPPRPHLHRWMSDSERRPTSGFPMPPTMHLPPLDHRSDSDSTPIERRRGDEQWQIPRVKETFAEWIMAREKALHWRCDDPVCLHAPPEHPFTDAAEEDRQEWKPTTERLIKIKSYKQHQFVGEEYTGPRPVCQHEFHASCLKVSCLSSNWWYREPGREETTVRCPRCRTQGWVVDETSDVGQDLTSHARSMETA